jgi:hypothetical protein
LVAVLIGVIRTVPHGPRRPDIAFDSLATSHVNTA